MRERFVTACDRVAVRRQRLGLLGMRERVRLVNGIFSILPRPGKGTTVRVTIPSRPVGALAVARKRPSRENATPATSSSGPGTLLLLQLAGSNQKPFASLIHETSGVSLTSSSSTCGRQKRCLRRRAVRDLRGPTRRGRFNSLRKCRNMGGASRRMARAGQRGTGSPCPPARREYRPQAVLGADDTIHLAYYRPDGSLWYRRLTREGRLTPAEPLASGLRTTRAEFGYVLPLLHIPSTDTAVIVYRLATGHLWERRSVKNGPLTPPRQVTDRGIHVEVLNRDIKKLESQRSELEARNKALAESIVAKEAAAREAQRNEDQGALLKEREVLQKTIAELQGDLAATKAEYEALRKQQQLEVKDAEAKVKEELKNVFNPEFLNRVDDTIVFHPLDRGHIAQIVQILLKDVRKRLAEEELTLTLTEAGVDFLVKHGYDEAYGARPLRRAIQRYIEDPLSEKILLGEFSRGDEIEVDVSQDGAKLDFRVLTGTAHNT